MKFLIDSQLSPAIAAWINREYPEHEASSVRSHGLVHAEDDEIFETARIIGAVLITKDANFVALLERHGPPPQVLWVTCGNTSNARMRRILAEQLATIVQLFQQGEPIVELSDR